MPDDLPDDVSRWPSDPFDVLGLTRPASETDAKRAYTKLIRRFKPEHHPDQFRRVREAYEAALEQIKWHGFEREFVEPARPPEPPRPEPPPPESTTDAEPRPRPVADSGYIDEAKAAWDAAIEGRDTEAYAAIVELAHARPERADLPLRLYWLLALNPALDPATTRHHWLAAALKRSSLGGSAAELFRREVRADPKIAFADAYADILSHPAPAANLRAIVCWRIRAAGAAGGDFAIHDDLAAVRDRLIRDDERAWLDLAVHALDFLTWEQSGRAYRTCRDALAELKHLELTHADAFDRLDELDRLAAMWREAKNWGTLPFAVLDAIRFGWALPYEESWPKVEEGAEAVVEEPDTVLYLYAEQTGAQAAVLLAYFTFLLERHARYSTGGPGGLSESAVRALVQAFVAQNSGSDYSDVRLPLLDFLVAEAILPDEFFAACDGGGLQELAAMVARDTPMRCVWLARYVLSG